MKKGFTLIEVLISITLLGIITIFLFQSLDMSEKSSAFHTKKIDQLTQMSDFKMILQEDLMGAKGDEENTTKPIINIEITEDRDENSIIKIVSKNSFHNPFYPHITYFLSKEGEFLRCESKNKLDQENLEPFFDQSYCDMLFVDLASLKSSYDKPKAKLAIAIIFKDGKEIFISQKGFAQ